MILVDEGGIFHGKLVESEIKARRSRSIARAGGGRLELPVCLALGGYLQYQLRFNQAHGRYLNVAGNERRQGNPYLQRLQTQDRWRTGARQTRQADVMHGKRGCGNDFQAYVAVDR